MKMTEIIKELVKILTPYDAYTMYIDNYNQMISAQKRNDIILENAKKFLADNGIVIKDAYGMASRVADTNKRDEEKLAKLYKDLYVDIIDGVLDSKLGNSPFCKDIAMKNGDILRFNSVSEFKVNVYKKGNTYLHDVYLFEVAKQIYNDYCA